MGDHVGDVKPHRGSRYKGQLRSFLPVPGHARGEGALCLGVVDHRADDLSCPAGTEHPVAPQLGACDLGDRLCPAWATKQVLGHSSADGNAGVAGRGCRRRRRGRRSRVVRWVARLDHDGTLPASKPSSSRWPGFNPADRPKALTGQLAPSQRLKQGIARLPRCPYRTAGRRRAGSEFAAESEGRQMWTYRYAATRSSWSGTVRHPRPPPPAPRSHGRPPGRGPPAAG